MNAMNAPYLPTPHWRELYQAALFESDAHHLPARIEEAEQAILDRAEELLTSGESSENEALSKALNAMRDLRRMYDIDRTA